MSMLKDIIKRTLFLFGSYPNIYICKNPLKIYEFKEIFRGINFSGDEQILDIGCGSGFQSMIIGKRSRKIYGIDISKKQIASAKRLSHYMKERIESEFRCIRIEDAQFENEFFDKILSICVLEHISNYDEVLREAYRILKKGGQILFSVDSLETIEDNELLEKHKNDNFVEKYFKKKELQLFLKEIGFRHVEVYPILKSDFAKRLFVKGINTKFRFGYLQSIIVSVMLRYKDNHLTKRDKGIFLIAKCYK